VQKERDCENPFSQFVSYPFHESANTKELIDPVLIPNADCKTVLSVVMGISEKELQAMRSYVLFPPFLLFSPTNARC
jgi:hypothetical protein